VRVLDESAGLVPCGQTRVVEEVDLGYDSASFIAGRGVS
jgi:hypothetical protein